MRLNLILSTILQEKERIDRMLAKYQEELGTLPKGTISGLRDALETLKGVPNISSVRFSAADVVRHGLVAKIVKAYEERSKKTYGDE